MSINYGLLCTSGMLISYKVVHAWKMVLRSCDRFGSNKLVTAGFFYESDGAVASIAN